MGNRLSRSPAVEAFYESYQLNQYLDLYSTIASSVGRKQSFRLRWDHFHIIEGIETTIDSLLAVITPHVTTLDMIPYRYRYTSAKKGITSHLRQLYDKDALKGDDQLLRAFAVV